MFVREAADIVDLFAYTQASFIPALPGFDMRSSDGLDPRRKMILFRAWHRGTKEMDLVLGKFADAELEHLSEDELDDLEQLMTAPDPEIYKWLSGSHPVPENWATPIVKRIRRFHGTAD